MKVVSKLVKMNFAVGSIERKDQYLIITSDPERSTMDSKVRLSPQDAVDILKASLSWSVISYALTLPFLYRREKRALQEGKKV